tara:strand:+ start:4834 stop:5235 length:402 start_codon:yes stop_codon:yes gene_type:complete
MSSSSYEEGGDSLVDTVQIDGLAVLKIIKHTKDNIPEPVTGQLLGLDVGTTLEVTNCFPFPSRVDGFEDGESADSGTEQNFWGEYSILSDEMDLFETTTHCTILPVGAEYQIEMMKHLRDVNVDSNTVGWYQV